MVKLRKFKGVSRLVILDLDYINAFDRVDGTTMLVFEYFIIF